ncbi:hypothetical protein DFS34DRAFT_21539 [Phlyctochytrium arcticum]|nr:hypothetical protein DFS34DRAFT_21539 [Phlyctochytrium arcticum]
MFWKKIWQAMSTHRLRPAAPTNLSSSRYGGIGSFSAKARSEANGKSSAQGVRGLQPARLDINSKSPYHTGLRPARYDVESTAELPAASRKHYDIDMTPESARLQQRIREVEAVYGRHNQSTDILGATNRGSCHDLVMPPIQTGPLVLTGTDGNYTAAPGDTAADSKKRTLKQSIISRLSPKPRSPDADDNNAKAENRNKNRTTSFGSLGRFLPKTSSRPSVASHSVDEKKPKDKKATSFGSLTRFLPKAASSNANVEVKKPQPRSLSSGAIENERSANLSTTKLSNTGLRRQSSPGSQRLSSDALSAAPKTFHKSPLGDTPFVYDQSPRTHTTTKLPRYPHSAQPIGNALHTDNGPSAATTLKRQRSKKISVSARNDLDTLLAASAHSRDNALKYALVPSSVPRFRVGLTNIGNTCFMNSILQCIFSVDYLMGYFLGGHYKNDINSNSPMHGQLSQAFAALVNQTGKALSTKSVSPSAFKKHLERYAPQFAGYQQQDSQEFLRFMLDGLHEDLNKVSVRPKYSYNEDDVDKLSDVDKARFSWNRYHTGNKSVIFDLFGGQLESTVTCLSCKHRSVTFDTYWDLSLPIPKSASSTSRLRSSHDESCSINDCLLEYVKEEYLDDAYKCEGCNTRQQASKSLRLYRCPEILVLHLKRFSYSEYSRDKIETDVDFPTSKLSLNHVLSTIEGADTDVTYDLCAVSNQMGNLGGGHYIAHVKNFDDGIWYQADDSRYYQVDGPHEAKGSSAYVLFYRRRKQESNIDQAK